MFVAVCLVAANMRMTITGVGPLLDDIAADRGVSAAALGALASVPLVVWGITSPLVHGLGARLGISRAVTISLVALALGTLWRSFPGSPVNLWAGTALIGASLAVGNVLLPAVIKRDFGNRVPLVMGVYTAMLGGIGAVGAGIVVPIAHFDPGSGDLAPWGVGTELGWRIALLCTALAVPPAILVWVIANAPRRRIEPVTGAADPGALDAALAPATATAPRRGSAGRRIWRDPLAWLVALYMGAQSGAFYMISTWLSPIGISHGRTPIVAGIDTMLYQVIGVAGSLLLPALFRGRLRRWIPALIPVCVAIAATGIVLFPAGMPVWICLGGLASGASLSTAITLMAVRARDHEGASALSGMAQSIGYTLAAVGPFTFGALHDLSGTWTVPLVLLLLALGAQFATGLAVGRERYVLED